MDVSQKHHVVSVKPFERIAIGTIIEKSILESGFGNGAMKEGDRMRYFGGEGRFRKGYKVPADS
jgi:hypothetical protein